MPTARLSLLLLPLLLSACMSRGLDPEFTSCTYPDSSRTPAPEFICSGRMEGFPVSRVVSVPASDVDTRDRIEQGRLEVREELVSTWLDEWFSDIEDGDEAEARALIGDWLDDEMRVIRTRTSPTGTLWLLVGLTETPGAIQQQLHLRLSAAGLLPRER